MSPPAVSCQPRTAFAVKQMVPFRSAFARRAVIGQRQVCRAGNNGSDSNGHAKRVNSCPSPAETARTIVDLAREGALSTVTADGIPFGSPTPYILGPKGEPTIQIAEGSIEQQNLQKNPKCSLLVQATTYPARAVGAVSLVGTLSAEPSSPENYRLTVDKCVYYGGLDQSGKAQDVSGEDYAAAEPDILRSTAAEAVATWNSERAEDIYRIASSHLGVPLLEMEYVELLWLDSLGMYVRAEVAGREPTIVRVPFYRPVIDDRDVRSVITMAAQLAWEKDRNYVPPVPSFLAELSTNN